MINRSVMNQMIWAIALKTILYSIAFVFHSVSFSSFTTKVDRFGDATGGRGINNYDRFIIIWMTKHTSKSTHRDESFGGVYDLNSAIQQVSTRNIIVCKKNPEHTILCFWHIQFLPNLNKLFRIHRHLQPISACMALSPNKVFAPMSKR